MGQVYKRHCINCLFSLEANKSMVGANAISCNPCSKIFGFSIHSISVRIPGLIVGGNILCSWNMSGQPHTMFLTQDPDLSSKLVTFSSVARTHAV